MTGNVGKRAICLTGWKARAHPESTATERKTQQRDALRLSMKGITTAIRQRQAMTVNGKNSLGRVPPRAATDTQPRSGFLVRVTLAGSARWLGLPHIDGGCIQRVLDV